MRFTYAPMIVVWCLLHPALFAQELERDDFRAFCNLIAGRWIGSTVRVVDSEFGKKGDEVATYFRSVMDADGHVLIGTFHSGQATSKWIVTYDPGAKAIVGLNSSSNGAFERIEILKQNGKWEQHRRGHLSDGTPIELTESLTVIDANTHRWAGSSSHGGQPNDDHSVTWQRVYRPYGSGHSLDATAQAEGTPPRTGSAAVKPPHDWPYLQGTWEFSNSRGDEARVTFRSTAGGIASASEWFTSNGDSAHESIGWDPEKQALIVNGYGQSGIHWHVEYTQVGKTQCSGPSVVHYSDGARVEGVLTIERVSDKLVKLQTVGSDQDGKQTIINAQFKKLD